MFTLAEDKSARTSDRFGRMRVEMTNISKANVCPYLGKEIPGYQALGLDAKKIYNLWRHPDELKKAAQTFDMVPVLDEHIATDAARPQKDYIAGTTGTGTVFEYPYLKTPMAIWVGDSIDGVTSRKKRELSPGYGYRPDMTPGVTPDGVAYDGIMRDIMGNHVAIVKEGRTGPDVMVADEKPLELVPMKREAVTKAIVAVLTGVALSPEQQLAVDTALDAAMCSAEKAAKKAVMDESPDDYEDDPGKPGEKRRKAKPAPQAHDAKVLTQADVDAAVKLAVDAALAKGKTDAEAAACAAREAERALAAARSDVSEIAGDCAALDSAEAVYRYALEQERVAGAKEIHASALPALWASVKAAKAAKTIATDSVTRSAKPDAVAAVAAIGF